MKSTNERKKKLEHRLELERHDRIANHLSHMVGINHH